MSSPARYRITASPRSSDEDVLACNLALRAIMEGLQEPPESPHHQAARTALSAQRAMEAKEAQTLREEQAVADQVKAIRELEAEALQLKRQTKSYRTGRAAKVGRVPNAHYQDESIEVAVQTLLNELACPICRLQRLQCGHTACPECAATWFGRPGLLQYKCFLCQRYTFSQTKTPKVVERIRAVLAGYTDEALASEDEVGPHYPAIFIAAEGAWAKAVHQSPADEANRQVNEVARTEWDEELIYESDPWDATYVPSSSPDRPSSPL